MGDAGESMPLPSSVAVAAALLRRGPATQPTLHYYRTLQPNPSPVSLFGGGTVVPSPRGSLNRRRRGLPWRRESGTSGAEAGRRARG